MRPLSFRKVGIILGAALALAMALAAAGQGARDEVNVYSYRQPFLIRPLFDAFERQTGIKVNVVFAEKGLVERLRQEGDNSPADLIFTVDIGRLSDAREAGLTQPVKTELLERNIPARFREPEGHWHGLTTRARVVFASRERVNPAEVTSYEDLAAPRWRGRICTRSGSHVYQVALLAAMIAHHGEDAAEAWLRGLKANLARKPQGNDRAQVKAISEGECDVSLGNNYYYGNMLEDEEQQAWARSVNVLFPVLGGQGTHLNISGMALTRSAPNKENAIRLMEFLAGDFAQQMYAEQNFEYPVKDGVPWNGLLRSLGAFDADTLPLAEIAKYRAAAIKLVDKVGYND